MGEKRIFTEEQKKKKRTQRQKERERLFFAKQSKHDVDEERGGRFTARWCGAPPAQAAWAGAPARQAKRSSSGGMEGWSLGVMEC